MEAHINSYDINESNATYNQTQDIVSNSTGIGEKSIISIAFNSQYTLGAIVTGLVLLIIIIVTIVGNILVCLAVFLVKKLRKPCNYLLVSLAVSDLCVAILVMPMAMLYQILGRWNFGNFMCDVWVAFDVLSCAASILNLCMISVDRYFAITKPLEYGVKRTPKRMILCVSMVWLGAACISLPPLLILGNEHDVSDDGVPHCTVCQNFGYQIYATLGSFYIPLTVMIVVYYKIFCAARRIVHEEKRAQSHLETTHCYLEISVKNGQGPPESRLAMNISFDTSPTPDKGDKGQHRTSNTSTGTMCSAGVNSGSQNNNTSCYPGQRPSNESQCPMLQPPGKSCRSMKKKLKLRSKYTPRPSRGSGAVGSIGTTTSNTKKLRFQLAKERKASTTLGIIMSAFIICWLPFFVLALVRPFLHDSKTIPSSLSSFFLWLGYANSLLNPVIYATLNRDFRRPFQQILFFRCGSLNHMMREEFYHSQYGDPEPPPHYFCSGSSPDRTTIHTLREIENMEIVNSKTVIPTTSANESFL